MFEAKCTWLTEIDKQLDLSDYKIVAQQMSDWIDEQVMKGIMMKHLAIALLAGLLFGCQTPTATKPTPVYCKTICTLDGGCVMECNK